MESVHCLQDRPLPSCGDGTYEAELPPGREEDIFQRRISRFSLCVVLQPYLLIMLPLPGEALVAPHATCAF